MAIGKEPFPGVPEYVRGFRNASGMAVRGLRNLIDRCEQEQREPRVAELVRFAELLEAEAHPANVECGAMIDMVQTCLNKRG
jgi:hypothetical protein